MPIDASGTHDHVVSKVDRRKTESRRRLTRAASELIAAKGVDGLRLRELTELADVGFGSFYSHFETKDQLVEAVVVDLMNELASAVIERVQRLDDPAKAGSAAHRWFIRRAVEAPDTAWLIVNLNRAEGLFEEAIREYAVELLQRGVDSGRFKPFDVEVTLSYVVSATLGVTRAVLEGRLGPGAERESTLNLLGVLGLEAGEAERLADTPLAELLVAE